MKNALITYLSLSFTSQARRMIFLTILIMASIVSLSVVDAQAGPEIAVSLEMEAAEFTTDFELIAGPVVTLEWPAYNFTLGSGWNIPCYPDLELGELELFQEYIVHLPLWWLDLKLENSDTWIFEDSELEGTASAGPVAYFLGTEIELLLEKEYAAESGLNFVPSISYEFELMLGTAGIGVTQTMDTKDNFKRGDTEFPVSYEFDAGEYLAIGLEFVPVFDEDREWNYSFTLALEWSLD